jgi:mRNA-decapping enzyme subunit 2
VSKAIATEVLDPQLARLLTSLSLSASAMNMADKASHLSIKTKEPAPSEPATPVPGSAKTASSTNSQRPLEMSSSIDWSSSAPKRLPPKRLELPLFTPPQVLSRRSSTETGPLSSRQSNFLGSFPPSTPHSSTSHFNSTQSQLGLQSQSLSQPSASPTTSASISPTRSYSSRRSSSTADISPYLMRPTELPMSGKRLKQLALLESVADESARMTPMLGQRESTYAGYYSQSSGPRYSFPPGPPASVPPPPFQPIDPDDSRVIYSSNPYAVPHVLPMPSASQHQPRDDDDDDDFRVRPRSQAYQRASLHPGFSPGSVSMNQNQLLAIMNGSHAAPSRPRPNISSSAIHTPPPPLGCLPHTSIPNGQRSVPGLHTMCTPPLLAPACAPSTNGFETGPPHPTRVNPNNSQLLSILNGDPSAVARGVPSLNGFGR